MKFAEFETVQERDKFISALNGIDGDLVMAQIYRDNKAHAAAAQTLTTVNGKLLVLIRDIIGGMPNVPKDLGNNG